jgi:hypothetical protein
VQGINQAMHGIKDVTFPRVSFFRGSDGSSITLHMSESENRDPIIVPQNITNSNMRKLEIVLNYINVQLNRFLSAPHADVAYVTESNLKCLFNFITAEGINQSTMIEIKDDFINALCSEIRETYREECNDMIDYGNIGKFLKETWNLKPGAQICSVGLILLINYLTSRLRLLRSKLKENTSRTTSSSMSGRPMISLCSVCKIAEHTEGTTTAPAMDVTLHDYIDGLKLSLHSKNKLIGDAGVQGEDSNPGMGREG